MTLSIKGQENNSLKRSFCFSNTENTTGDASLVGKRLPPIPWFTYSEMETIYRQVAERLILFLVEVFQS